MGGRVLFYVQHLLGVGHLKRAALIAKAMASAGLDVSVVLGGTEVAGIGFDGCSRVLLPAVRAADETFRRLIDDSGKPLDAELKDRRTHQLLAAFEAFNPDVLLIEQFPFGRRQFRFELMPLLEAARCRASRPLIVSSIRDVLVRKADPARITEMIRIAEVCFDRILVHGDPRLLPLEASFPECAALARKIIYTGYVVDGGAACGTADTASGGDEVIVTAGGGAVGETLLRTALAARPLSSLADRAWRLITGPNLPDRVFEDIAWNCPPGVIVERWRDDLPALFRNCRLVIAQAGYNTVMDILTTGARAVVVPFSTPTETEQALRAGALAARGALIHIEAADLSPNLLAAACDEALTKPPNIVDVDCGGAEQTARIVARMHAMLTDRPLDRA